jgi:hypothetical protein
VGSSLITTLAIVRANYDARKDYLSNFEPFVVDGLKRWNGRPVEPAGLRDLLCSEFSLPALPINTAKQLIDRVAEDGFLRHGADGNYPDPRRLDAVPPLSEGRDTLLRHVRELTETLTAYANAVHHLEWTEADAEKALERFVEEFSVEMATAKRTRAFPDRATADLALAVVHGFARHALERDQASLDHLEEVVRASMLTNVLYFHDAGPWSPTLPQLTVYLDTPVVLRMLGWAPEPLVAAAAEMLSLLREFKVSTRVFKHTIVEIQGILEGARMGIRHALAVKPAHRSNVPRGASGEVVQYLIANNKTAADVEQMSADLERELMKLGVSPDDGPDYPDLPDFSEKGLEETLQKVVRYRERPPLLKDVQSLASVHILRRGQPTHDLRRLRALFVTDNERLVRASRNYFKRANLESGIPHCMTDLSLTTQLWVRKPEKSPQIPRMFLIAESYAALNPDPETWERYLAAIERQAKRGAIDDRQVKILVYSNDARERFLEITHGDPDAVEPDTPLEVIAQHEAELLRPAEEKAQEVARERDALRMRVDEQERKLGEQESVLAHQSARIEAQAETIASLEEWKDNEEGRRQRSLRKRRKLAISIAVAVGEG